MELCMNLIQISINLKDTHTVTLSHGVSKTLTDDIKFRLVLEMTVKS